MRNVYQPQGISDKHLLYSLEYRINKSSPLAVKTPQNQMETLKYVTNIAFPVTNEFLLCCVRPYTFASVKPQDHSLWCSWRPKRIGHEQVVWGLHHRRLPAEEGRTALHPSGTARRGCMSQCKSNSL